MKIKLNSYKLLFRLLDLLSNSKWLHKLVVNRKVYLGASIISLSMANSGCTSSKINVCQNSNTDTSNLKSHISEKNTDSSYSDVPKTQNLDTSVAIIMCYKSAELDQDAVLDTTYNSGTSFASVSCYGVSAPIESGEKDPNPYVPNKVPIDLNSENISRINDLASNIRRPKGTEKIHGTIFVQFTITIDGTIRNVRIQKGLHPMLDEEIVKAVKKMRSWIWSINYVPDFDIDYIVPIQILSNEN